MNRLLLTILTALVCLAARADTFPELETELFERERLTAKAGVPRRLLLAGIAADRTDRAYDALGRWLEKAATEKLAERGRDEEVAIVGSAAAAMGFLQLVHTGGDVVPRNVDWLLATDERLRTVVGLITLADDWKNVCRTLDTLHEHDPDGSGAWFDLILALAVVWDQPRQPLHGQTGGAVPAVRDEITAYYDYFRDLYESRGARMRYGDLSPRALVFVVDTPVDLAELEWARDEVRGTHRNWGSRYDDVRYRDDRLESGRFIWNEGAYTLEALEDRGGICVDQAYYATITARANGIPAMIFTGQGRRGPHAWFGFMKSEREWEMDIGRYRFDKYQIGHTTDPQTNRVMTDHDVDFSCHRAFRTHSFLVAEDCGLIALQLLGRDAPEAAWQWAERAKRLVDVYDLPWRVQQHLLMNREKWTEAIDLLEDKARTFRKYPDYVLAIRRQQAAILRRLGRDDEAAALLDDTERDLDDRDDLLGNVILQQVRQLEREGEVDEARDKLEDFIQDQRREGVKVLPLLHEYLRLTRATGQTREAVRFLKRRTRRAPDEFEVHYLQLLYQAYRNDGDDRNAERTLDKLDRAQGW